MWCDLFLPYFWHEFINDLHELFSSLFNQFCRDLLMFSCIFHFSIYLLSSLCLHHLGVQHRVLQSVCALSTLLHCHCSAVCTRIVHSAPLSLFCSLYAHCPLCSTVTVRPILQFKVLLMTLRSLLLDFCFVAYDVTLLSPTSNVCSLNPFLILFTSW